MGGTRFVPVATRLSVRGRSAAATIVAVAVTDDKPLAEQLSELGAQLAWVRDYL